MGAEVVRREEGRGETKSKRLKKWGKKSERKGVWGGSRITEGGKLREEDGR